MVTVTFTPADGGESIVSEVTKASVLREVALGEKVALYQGMNKLPNCGGIGNCGTCRVNVEQGAELLSPRTDVETKKLKGKPEANRLACQCLVGGGRPEGAEVRVTTRAAQVSGAFVTCEERRAPRVICVIIAYHHITTQHPFFGSDSSSSLSTSCTSPAGARCRFTKLPPLPMDSGIRHHSSLARMISMRPMSPSLAPEKTPRRLRAPSASPSPCRWAHPRR